MNVNAIIDAIVAEGGFDTDSTDTSRTVILGWVQTRYDQALSSSRYRKQAVALGPTVAGQAQYAIPAYVLEIRKLRVAASKPWKRGTTEDLWNLQAGAATAYNVAGVYAPNFETDADQVVELWPVPGKSGDAIDALCEVTDPTQLTDTAMAPAVPADLHRPLFVKGGIAEGLTTVEKRPDLAAPFEGEFAGAAKELKRRANSRVGKGPWQARVYGR
jgi:hypothetical protein